MKIPALFIYLFILNLIFLIFFYFVGGIILNIVTKLHVFAEKKKQVNDRNAFQIYHPHQQNCIDITNN